jgi:hypothetical protein
MAAIPENINSLSPVSFKLVLQKFPNLEFFATGVSVPAVSSGVTTANLSQRNMNIYGDKLTFEDLSVKLIVDEDMKSYKEIFDWINASVMDQSILGDQFSDITLMVMTSHNNENRTFTFKNAIPTSIGGLEFDAGATEVSYITADVVFSFSDMTIE